MSLNVEETLLRNGFPIHEAIIGGDVLEVKETIIKYPSEINQPNEHNFSPLMVCSQLGFAVIAKLLVENGAEVNFKGGKLGISPLHLAAKYAKTEVVQFLLECGADLNIKTSEGFTPLLLAAARSHTNVVQMLIDHGSDFKSDINIRGGRFEDSLLHLGARCAQENFLEFLIKSGLDINVKNNTGSTPLHTAAENGHFEIVTFLLENGGNVNSVDLDKNTPLHVAVQRMNVSIETIKILLNYGADFKKKNKDGKSALEESKVFSGNVLLSMIVHKMIEKQFEETEKNVDKHFHLTLDPCVVCDNPRKEVFSLLPCGHAKTCEVCCLKLIALTGPNANCPICRSKITDYKKIYV